MFKVKLPITRAESARIQRLKPADVPLFTLRPLEGVEIDFASERVRARFLEVLQHRLRVHWMTIGTVLHKPDDSIVDDVRAVLDAVDAAKANAKPVKSKFKRNRPTR